MKTTTAIVLTTGNAADAILAQATRLCIFIRSISIAVGAVGLIHKINNNNENDAQ